MLAGHPWIYRNQLPQDFGAPLPCWVQLRAGKVSAYALWDPSSALALRVYSRERLPDAEWFERRVAEAWQLRELWRDPTRTDAFRWLNGEGDLLPGLVADYYAGYVVVTLASSACELIVPQVVEAMGRTTSLQGVVLRRSSRHKEGSDARSELELLAGAKPPLELIVKENGLRLHANLYSGQKTGLFLDQRDNRSRIEAVAEGRSVLNLFSYSGAFSLYAVRGGAKEVISVDSSQPAIKDARQNFVLNDFALTPHRFEVQDVFEFLERARVEQRRFDLVICDPPSFGSQQAQLDRALHAYTRLFSAALKVTAPLGLFAAASCTARVTPLLLTQALAEAAKKARRQVQLIADAAHAADHPIGVGHPEGRYLKFLLGRVSPRC